MDNKVMALVLLGLIALVGTLIAAQYLLSLARKAQLLHEAQQKLRAAEQRYEDLQAEQQHLREQNQLKDQFLLTASHELRTPLTSVQGYLELMAEYHNELSPEKCRNYLQKAQRSCEELVMLFGSIMDASRLEANGEIQPEQLELTSVQDMIQSVLNIVEPRMIKERRELHLHITPDLQVRANPAHLRQALLNISINALKYSPPQTPITISAQAASDGISTVEICIADRGQGIAPQDQARVFQLLVRLDRDASSIVPGSGLGLYISNLFVEAMGGKIWIESRGIPGEGTTFHIQLSGQASRSC